MWRPILGYVAIDFHAIVAALMLEPWEHILPARRGQNIPGAAKARTCCMRSKASIRPAEVRCVILGQGPQLRFRCWSRLSRISSRATALESAVDLIDGWVGQGVLALKSSCTLFAFLP
jgi:hypothetical protein